MEKIKIQKNKICLSENPSKRKISNTFSLAYFTHKISKSIQEVEFKKEEKKNYLKNIINISDLFLLTQNDIIFSKPSLDKIIQVTILRDKSSIKNKLFGKYHVFISSNFEYYLMSVSKCTCIFQKYYIFSKSPSYFKKKSKSYLGKLIKNKINYILFSDKNEKILSVNFVF